MLLTLGLLLGIQIYSQVDSPLYQLERAPLKIHTVEGAEITLNVVTVSEREDQARGLMHVRFLPLDQGMLFHHTRDNKISMWMKNTYVPLDMWFFKDDGTISRVVTDTQPMSLESISSELPVRGVVEVNAGLSRIIGVSKGAKLQHSVFSDDED